MTETEVKPRITKLLEDLNSARASKSVPKSTADWKSMVAELREGDGVDPRKDKKPSRDKTSTYERRDTQLASQIERSLSIVIPGFGDPDLGELLITSVIKAKKSNLFEVTLVPKPGVIDLDISAMQNKLNSAKNFLRSEVARDINRSKVPDLRFIIKPEE